MLSQGESGTVEEDVKKTVLIRKVVTWNGLGIFKLPTKGCVRQGQPTFLLYFLFQNTLKSMSGSVFRMGEDTLFQKKTARAGTPAVHFL